MLGRIDRAVCLVFGLVIFIGACLVSLSIVFRQTGIGHSWIDPVVRYAILWCALLGLWARAGLRQDPHIAAEMLISRAGPRLSRVLGVFRYAVAIGFLAVLGYVGWLQVASELRTGIREQSILRLPYAWLHLVIPISAALYVLITLGRMRAVWRGEYRE
jgi:TRAP-type C4-dicarboxylate transport system permease small subunit